MSITTPPRNTASFFIALAVFIIGLGFVARDAFAYQSVVNVEFQELDASYERGNLVVDYKIRGKHWKALRSAQIKPKLRVYEGRESRRTEITTVRINERKGRIIVRDVRPHSQKIGFALFGKHHRTRIGEVAYGKQCASRVWVNARGCQTDHRVKKKKHKKKGHKGFHRIVEICKEKSHKGRECVERAERIGRGAVGVLQVCSASTQWSSDFDKCVYNASNLQTDDKKETVQACSSATEWSSDFHKCVKTAGKFRSPPSPTIAACDRATEWSSDFHACMKTTSTYGFTAAGVVSACADNTEWSSDFKTCLDRAQIHGTFAEKRVRSCGARTEWSSDFKKCVDSKRSKKRVKKHHHRTHAKSHTSATHRKVIYY